MLILGTPPPDIQRQEFLDAKARKLFSLNYIGTSSSNLMKFGLFNWKPFPFKSFQMWLLVQGCFPLPFLIWSRCRNSKLWVSIPALFPKQSEIMQPEAKRKLKEKSCKIKRRQRWQRKATWRSKITALASLRATIPQ